MNTETFARRVRMLHLRENLIVAKEGRNSQKLKYSDEAVSEMIKPSLQEVLDGHQFFQRLRVILIICFWHKQQQMIKLGVDIHSIAYYVC